MDNNTNKNIIKEAVKKILNEDSYLTKKDDMYIYEIYADYRDKLNESDIKNILSKDSSEAKMDAFNDLMYDFYFDHAAEIFDNYKREIVDYISEHHSDIEYPDDDINEYLEDLLSIEYPTDHYLNTSVKANLILDTGDANYDFSVNSLDSIKDDGLSEESAILWVAKSQGYTKEETEKAIIEDKYNNSKFLKSISEEVLNANSMNAFTFLVDTTLEDLINFNKDTIKSVTISKNTNCGLVDFWYGAGGMIEVSLEKDLEIPVSIIDSFDIDGNRGTYSIDRIYGMADDAWNGEVKYNLK